MRARILLPLLVLAALLVAVPPARAMVAGGFVVRCDYSHTNLDDPIVFPGQVGASHMHDFFGNTTTNATSTYQSMTGSASNCMVATDTAGYWVPTPFFNGLQFHASGRGSDMRIYYQAGGADSMETIPPDMRMIAGDKSATGPPPQSVLRWYCGAGPQGKTPFSSHPYDCTELAKQYKFVDGVVAIIDMPRCWDGVGLQPTNVARPVGGSGTQCPNGFPHLLPQVGERVHFGVMDPCAGTTPCGPDDSDENVVLSFASGPYYTFHADFWNTWNQQTLDNLMADCLNAHVGCGFLNPNYRLDVARAGNGLGTVASDPPGVGCGTVCSVQFLTGTQVRLTASPAYGSRFMGWGGDCSGTGACTFGMEKDQAVTARFEPVDGQLFKLTVVRNGEGSVTSSPGGIECGDTCQSEFAGGSTVSLQPEPAAGMRFVRWGGACHGTETCRVVMRTKLKAVAFFEPLVHKPDAQVRTGRQGSFSGNNVFNGTGSGQTAVSAVPRGSTGVFVIRLENDGNAPETFSVKGTGDVRRFSARYLAGISGPRPETRAVRSGGYTTSTLAPGRVAYLRLWVHVPRKAPVRARPSWVITASAGGARDAVRATVDVVRS